MHELPGRPHSRLGASSAHRWIKCPGSVALAEQVIREAPALGMAGPAAAQGTVAHHVAELSLMMGDAPSDYVGHEFLCDGHEITFSEEDAEAVERYLAFLEAVAPEADQRNGNVKLMTEVGFDLHHLHPDLGGTSDSVIYYTDGSVLIVADYKHGSGYEVAAEGNPQLKIYALGALAKVAEMGLPRPRKVRLVIVQPRTGGDAVDEHWTTPDVLETWGEQILKRAAHRCTEPNAPRNAGEQDEDWCRFCPAQGACPEFREKSLAICRAEFAEAPVLPDPCVLDMADLVKIVKFSAALSSYSRQCEAYLQGRMEQGEDAPGMKLVAKRSNRRWIDEQAAASTLVSLLGEEAYERKVLSVAKAEKKLGKGRMAELAELVCKPDNGLVVAPAEDKRPAVKAIPAVLDFVDSLDFMQ